MKALGSEKEVEIGWCPEVALLVLTIPLALSHPTPVPSREGGMTVVVSEGEDWWMSDVIYKEGGTRDPKVPTLFQISCVDTGVIRWVNADLVTHVVPAT